MARTWHRLGVIATAVAIIAAAGVWYADPQLPLLPGQPTAAQPSALNAPFSVTYEFLTPGLGWALVVDYSALTTRFFVFHTIDGGNTWEKQYVGKARGDRPYLHFYDAEHGFAYAGYSYRTLDGGAHWRAIRVPDSQPYVAFATPVDGWSQSFKTGSPRIYRTRDGGMHWLEDGAGPPASESVRVVVEPQTSTFDGDCNGWFGAASVNFPAVYATADCGENWQPISLLTAVNVDYEAHYQTAPRMVPGNSVMTFVSDDSGHVLAAFISSDAGVHWRGVSFPAALTAPENISFLDAGHWWIVAGGSIYATDSAGRAWTRLEASGIPAGWSFVAGKTVDALHAWGIVSPDARPQVSALAATSDGGLHWMMQTSPRP